MPMTLELLRAAEDLRQRRILRAVLDSPSERVEECHLAGLPGVEDPELDSDLAVLEKTGILLPVAKGSSEATYRLSPKVDAALLRVMLDSADAGTIGITRRRRGYP